jgi:hypothetical protein
MLPKHRGSAGQGGVAAWRGLQLDPPCPCPRPLLSPTPPTVFPPRSPASRRRRAERLALVGRAAVSSRTAAATEERLLQRFYMQGKAAHNKARAEERRAQRGLAKQQ